MKKRFLRFYDKVIIATLLGVLALFGCTRKTYPEKQKSETSTDSLKNIKNELDNPVIAMYGVRPTRNIEE